jgi:hypothetical protein
MPIAALVPFKSRTDENAPEARPPNSVLRRADAGVDDVRVHAGAVRVERVVTVDRQRALVDPVESQVAFVCVAPVETTPSSSTSTTDGSLAIAAARAARVATSCARLHHAGERGRRPRRPHPPARCLRAARRCSDREPGVWREARSWSGSVREGAPRRVSNPRHRRASALRRAAARSKRFASTDPLQGRAGRVARMTETVVYGLPQSTGGPTRLRGNPFDRGVHWESPNGQCAPLAALLARAPRNRL